MAGAPSAGTVPVSGASAGDPMRRFTAEGQDPALVQQAYARASEILTSGETLEYVAVANKGSLTHAPDCAVATNKRIMLYRKKVLGKLEQDDYYWRDVNAALKDGRGGVTFTVESIKGWQMAIESLPRAQAVRLYELAVAHSEKLADALRLKVIQQDAAAPVPAMPPPPTADVYASGPLPTRTSVPALPTIKTPPPPLETPAMQAP